MASATACVDARASWSLQIDRNPASFLQVLCDRFLCVCQRVRNPPNQTVLNLEKRWDNFPDLQNQLPDLTVERNRSAFLTMHH